MSDYIRPRVPGACVFFTVALADRGSQLLVKEVERLRAAVRETMTERPFRIETWVVLPDHLHAVWTLPEEDADYSVRLRRSPKRARDMATAVLGASCPRG
jgi:putative transposase